MHEYLRVGLAIVSPFFLLLVITLIISFINYRHISRHMKENDALLKKAVHLAITWLTAATFWMCTEYLFVIIPFVANAIVIYLSLDARCNGNNEKILVYSIISLAFIVFGYAINPQRHKKCYRKAYSVLDHEINKYLLSSNPNEERESLVKTIQSGEELIDISYDVNN